MLNALAIGSLVFLILYAIVFTAMTYLYASKRIKFKSRWSFLYFHVLIRLASQGVGLGFGIQGFQQIGLLVAFLILGAEGYFSLVLCTARFLISFHEHHFGESWLERKEDFKGKNAAARFVESFRLEGLRRRPMGVVHWLLIAANAIIIAGGNLLAGNSQDASTAWYTSDSLQAAKAMRAAGQMIFLLINVAFAGAIAATVVQYKRVKGASSNRFYGHPTLGLLIATWPLLFIRGVFGVCQALINPLNYYYPGNFNSTGYKDEFVVKEEVLATMTEWLSCMLLVLTYVTSLHDPKKSDVQEASSADGETGETGLRGEKQES